jgi:cytochrome c oxidase subunit 2
MIIISILIPSLYLLYSSDDALVPVLTFKVLGHQWYWAYEFNNWIQISKEDDLRFVSYEFDSYLIHTDDLELGQKRLLEVDNRLIVPASVPLRFIVTSGDVLHSWAVPELGIKIDAVPGRLNQVITFIIRPGVYYGQCSELCGVSHGFMPIVVVAQWPEMWFGTLSNSNLSSQI